MVKRLSIIGVILIAAIFIIARSRSPKSVESKPVFQQHMDANGIETPELLNPRQRSTSDLTIKSLCERLFKADKIGTKDAVYSKIRSQLTELDNAQLIQMLGELKSANCGEASKSNLELAIVDALSRGFPELALDYVLSRYPEDPERWAYFTSMLFDSWVKQDFAGLTAWLDGRRKLLLTDLSPIIAMGETSNLTKLIQSDPAAAMKRANSLPEAQALAIIGNTFCQRSDLLGPDQAIDFLRESLNRKGHEELVGITCGLQLYSKGLETLHSFFIKHDASQAEREAILFQAVEMQVNMGFKGTPDEFIQRTRQFAEDEDVRNANELTAVILGTTADRDHEDKRAVNQLLSYKPGRPVIQIFLNARGKSLDTTQAKRIDDYLKSSDSTVGPSTDSPSPP